MRIWLSLWCSLLATPALSHSPDGTDSAMAPWFRSLQTPWGSPCCSEQDCHTVELGRTLRIEEGRYWVRDESPQYEEPHPDWIPVVPQRVLPRYDNPTGKYVACVYQHRVLCFVQGTGS